MIPKGRVGILGGTFDPPHFGHLVLAQEAVDRFDLLKVLFVPTRRPPHKQSHRLTPLGKRLRMLQLSVAGEDSFEVADLESTTGYSYTVDLLQALDRPAEDTFFVMGMDALLELDTWKQPDRLLGMASVVVGTRPGYDPEGVRREFVESVRIFEIPGLWISSTQVRERFALGRPTKYLIPESARTFILREAIYG
ncbi:nicotinate (nicotinamide) nucleotide adenylyltransferase [Candidatus Fermentibacteria bacterium]|nr:nicotinate (nicotinamide) nucleotide adenylyltransferase [Candidatus Fermentibacteria bacterium]